MKILRLLLVFVFVGCATQSTKQQSASKPVVAPKPMVAQSRSSAPIKAPTVSPAKTLAWNPNAIGEHIVSYRVYEQNWDGHVITKWRPIGNSITTTFTTAPLTYGIHMYHVTALNALGMESRPSNQVNVTSQ